MALDAYALTTLDSAKANMRISDTSDDALLTDLINQVSGEIERVCGVTFKARDFREWHNWPNNRRILLKCFPVISVTRASSGYGTAFTVRYTGADIRADVAVNATGLTLTSYGASGVTTNTVTTANTTASHIVSVIGGISGWSATLCNDAPAPDLLPMATGDAKAGSVEIAYPDTALQFQVDTETGVLELHSPYYSQTLISGGRTDRYRGFQSVLVQYRAGYETIPADVMLMANRLVQDAYYDGLTARGLTAGSIGPFTWKASATQSEDIRDALASHLDPSKFVGGVL